MATKRGKNAKHKNTSRKRSQRQAADMAGRELDRLGDQSASDNERAQRKRQLIKGPREFRGMREDLPRTKGRG